MVKYWSACLLVVSLLAAGPVWAQDASGAAATPDADGRATEEITAPGEPLRIGDTGQGELTVDSPALTYNFSGSAGDIIAITMRSDQIDSYLRLTDLDGNVLVFDDDGAGALDARIGPIMLPSDGTLLIVASSFEAVVSDQAEIETGKFDLSISRYEAETIAYPGETQGALGRDDPLAVYRIEAQAGDILRLSLTSTDFDPLLVVTGTERLAPPIARDDDSGEGTDALIVPFVVPATGAYLLATTSFQRYAPGAFTLGIERLEAQTLAYGDTVETTISREQQAGVYAFAGHTGDTIDVVVEALDRLDTTLTLIDPSGARIAFSDDASGRNPALRGQSLPADGTYTLLVQSFRQGSTGDFRLTLSLSDKLS